MIHIKRVGRTSKRWSHHLLIGPLRSKTISTLCAEREAIWYYRIAEFWCSQPSDMDANTRVYTKIRSQKCPTRIYQKPMEKDKEGKKITLPKIYISVNLPNIQAAYNGHTLAHSQSTQFTHGWKLGNTSHKSTTVYNLSFSQWILNPWLCLLQGSLELPLWQLQNLLDCQQLMKKQISNDHKVITKITFTVTPV